MTSYFFASLCYNKWAAKWSGECHHRFNKLNESVPDWNTTLQGSTKKRPIFDVIGTSSWSPANLSVCSCWDACFAVPVCPRSLVGCFFSFIWLKLPGIKATSLCGVHARAGFISEPPCCFEPLTESLCRADMNRQGQRMRRSKNQSMQHLVKCTPFYSSTYFLCCGYMCYWALGEKKSGNLVLHNKMKVIAIWQLTSPSFYLHVFTYYPNPHRPKSLHLGN